MELRLHTPPTQQPPEGFRTGHGALPVRRHRALAGAPEIRPRPVPRPRTGLQGQRVRLRSRAAGRRGHPLRLRHARRRNHLRGSPHQGLVQRRPSGPHPVPPGRGAGAAARPRHPLRVLRGRRARPGGRAGRHRVHELDEAPRRQGGGARTAARRHRGRTARRFRPAPAAGPHGRLGRRRGGHRLDGPAARGPAAAAHHVRQPSARRGAGPAPAAVPADPFPRPYRYPAVARRPRGDGVPGCRPGRHAGGQGRPLRLPPAEGRLGRLAGGRRRRYCTAWAWRPRRPCTV